MRNIAHIPLLTFIAGLWPVAGMAAVTDANVKRIDADRVVLSWSSDANVDIYMSIRPSKDIGEAQILSLDNRDNRFMALVRDDRRTFLLLRDTADDIVTVVAERDLPLERASNFRDLGGYEAADGRRLRWGKIFRSGATPLLSDRDLAYLATTGLTSMVDLRSTRERQLAPTRLSELGVRYTAIDYTVEDLGIGRSAADIYEDALTVLAPQFRAIFQDLLSNRTPIAYNCTAGQDRTGIATALILSALGVNRKTILEDYDLSTELRQPEYESNPIAPTQPSGDAAAIMLANARATKPKPLYSTGGRPLLAEMFDKLDARWGSVDLYLAQALGIGPNEIAKLREQYLE